MTPNILPLHIPRRAEILIPIRKAHKAIPFTLRRPLIPHHPRLLHGGELGEGLEEGFVRDFAGEVTDKETEVGGVPFEEGGVLPCLAAAGADDGFLLAAGVGDDGGYACVRVGGGRYGGGGHCGAGGVGADTEGGRVGGCAGAVGAKVTIAAEGAGSGTGSGGVGFFTGVGALPLCDLGFHFWIDFLTSSLATACAAGGCLTWKREGVSDLGRSRFGIGLILGLVV